MRRTNTLTTSGVGTSAWLPLDNNIIDFQVGLFLDITGTATVTVEATLDDVQDSTVTPVAFSVPITALVGATADQIGTLTMPVKGIRSNQTLGAGSSILKVLQQGII